MHKRVYKYVPACTAVSMRASFPMLAACTGCVHVSPLTMTGLSMTGLRFQCAPFSKSGAFLAPSMLPLKPSPFICSHTNLQARVGG